MRSIKWYLKGLFPVKFTITMFSGLIAVELLFYTVSPADSRAQILVELSILLINPFVLLSAFLHVFRSKEMTLFESSLLSSWKGIALARIVSAFLYILAFWIVQSVFLILTTSKSTGTNISLLWLIPTTLSFFLAYIGLGLLVSLISNRASSMLLSAMVFFFLPLSAQTLLNNYIQRELQASGFITYLSYYLNPEWTYLMHLQYPDLVIVHLKESFIYSLIVTLVITVTYYLAFNRLQFKP